MEKNPPFEKWTDVFVSSKPIQVAYPKCENVTVDLYLYGHVADAQTLGIEKVYPVLQPLLWKDSPFLIAVIARWTVKRGRKNHHFHIDCVKEPLEKPLIINEEK